MRRRRPTANGERREALWLADHADYGGQIHEKTVDALIAALNEPSDRSVGHAPLLQAVRRIRERTRGRGRTRMGDPHKA